MIPTVSWDETRPLGQHLVSTTDDRLQEMKTQLREIIDVDHEFESSGHDTDWGFHKQVTLIEAADIGTGAEGVCILGAETASNNGTDKPELTFTDEDDDDVQITRDGVLADLSGFIDIWGGTIANLPTGYLICDGTAVSRTTYVDLFTAVGTTNGAGDESNTFNLPNMADRFVIGTKTGGTYSPGDGSDATTHTHPGPSHSHTVQCTTSNTSTVEIRGAMGATTMPNPLHTHTIDANTVAGGTGTTSSGTSLPPYYATCYIIKI